MRSRFRGSANVGPYTTIIGFLREHGEVTTDFLAGQLVELEPSMLEGYLDRLAKAGAIERKGTTVRLADSGQSRLRRPLLHT
jgi:hypothetical protein